MVMTACAFAPIRIPSGTVSSILNQRQQRTIDDQKKSNIIHPSVEANQRQSVGSVVTMGLFGLGGPEIVIILIAGAFLLGPQKLADLGKQAGSMTRDLKDIPAEFQKGMEEGEAKATMKSRKKKKNLGPNEPIQTVDAAEVKD